MRRYGEIYGERCGDYPHASVLQADFEGFTALSARYPPSKVLSLLSDIFEAFDGLADKHGADKRETIGN